MTLSQDIVSRIKAVSWAGAGFAYVFISAKTSAAQLGTVPPAAPSISVSVGGASDQNGNAIAGAKFIGQIDTTDSQKGVQGPPVTHYFIWYGFAPAPTTDNWNNAVFNGAGAGGAGNVGLPGTNYAQQFSIIYVDGFGDWNRSFPLDALTGDFTNEGGAFSALAAYNAHYSANVASGIDHRGYFTSGAQQIPPPASDGSGGFILTPAILTSLVVPADPPISSTGLVTLACIQVPMPSPGNGSTSGSIGVSIFSQQIGQCGAEGASDMTQITSLTSGGNPGVTEAVTEVRSDPHGGSYTINWTVINTNAGPGQKPHQLILDISGGSGAQGAS